MVEKFPTTRSCRHVDGFPSRTRRPAQSPTTSLLFSVFSSFFRPIHLHQSLSLPFVLPPSHVLSHLYRSPHLRRWWWLPARPPRLRELKTFRWLQSCESRRPPREAPKLRSSGRGLCRDLLSACEAAPSRHRKVPHCLDILGGFVENRHSVE